MSEYCLIPEHCQSIWGFLENVPAAQHHRELLTQCLVKKVEINTRLERWKIFVSTPQQLPAAIIKLAEDSLCQSCEVTKVIFIQQIKKLEDYLERQWNDFTRQIAGNNPSVKHILTTAQHTFDGKELIIETLGDWAVEMLHGRNVDREIKEYFLREFGRSCGVTFTAGAVGSEQTLCEEDYLTPEYMAALNECTSPPETKKKDKGNDIILGRNIKDMPVEISTVQEEDRNIVFEGEILNVKLTEFRTGNSIVTFDLVDGTDGISCKVFFKDQDKEQAGKIMEELRDGMTVRLKGMVRNDKYSDELMMYPDSICKVIKPERLDTADTPRVELHLHTRMSSMDSVVAVKSLIKTAAKWRHPAVAITDHGVVQAFPEAQEEAAKAGIKVIYGMEGYLFEQDINQARHIVILVQNSVGLRNLYRLVSLSHLKYLHRKPRIPRAVLTEHREGLLFGSACEAGDLIQAMLHGATDAELDQIAAYYDYLEIQPTGNNAFLLREGKVGSEEELRQINRRVCQIGERLNKPVVATCDVHFLNPEDHIYRAILMAGQGYSDADKQPPLYFRTTEEMLAEFDYLGKDKAYEVVVETPRQINDRIEVIKPIPDELYSPQIPGAEEQIQSMAYAKAAALYGKELPEIVAARLKLELDSIINHGFAVLYLIAHKLVKKSLDDGYLVGSRGSVGSSFVATMTDITEVNPLPPHWRCPECKHSEFVTDGSYGSGFDLPDKKCPACNMEMKKDGHDIPFAVFMGFNGDKVPDIDLNFSGDYQPVAHKYTEELFGKDNVFRAGTISTIADKKAYGFVKKYFSEKNTMVRNARVNKLVSGCGGVKQTTGQHPGGIMVVPRDMDVHHFTPIQYPADKNSSSTITTHFDYHSISSRLVKLDILGHDDPTVIRMLEDLTGRNAKTIPFDDPATMSLFSSTEALGLTPEQLGSTVGTFGIPEFGTKFVRQMLEDTKPRKFSELVRISGFSHGTDVWLNNAQDLIKNGIAKLSEAISARDDIMIYLIQKGLPPKMAFQTMEMVRKGKGKSIKEEDIQKMLDQGVPQWYIESCRKIQYMFPKAHAVAYVMMAVRIAYCKVHYPLAFYAAYFTVRATEFDAGLIVKGEAAIRAKLSEFEERGNDLTAKEKGLQTILEMTLELYLRNFSFQKVSLYESHATKFLIAGNGLLPPLAALEGLGDTAARNIVQAREPRPFSSQEDLRVRSRVSKTVIDILKEHGCLDDLPETDQIMLFA